MNFLGSNVFGRSTSGSVCFCRSVFELREGPWNLLKSLIFASARTLVFLRSVWDPCRRPLKVVGLTPVSRATQNELMEAQSKRLPHYARPCTDLPTSFRRDAPQVRLTLRGRFPSAGHQVPEQCQGTPNHSGTNTRIAALAPGTGETDGWGCAQVVETARRAIQPGISDLADRQHPAAKPEQSCSWFFQLADTSAPVRELVVGLNETDHYASSVPSRSLRYRHTPSMWAPSDAALPLP